MRLRLGGAITLPLPLTHRSSTVCLCLGGASYTVYVRHQGCFYTPAICSAVTGYSWAAVRMMMLIGTHYGIKLTTFNLMHLKTGFVICFVVVLLISIGLQKGSASAAVASANTQQMSEEMRPLGLCPAHWSQEEIRTASNINMTILGRLQFMSGALLVLETYPLLELAFSSVYAGNFGQGDACLKYMSTMCTGVVSCQVTIASLAMVGLRAHFRRDDTIIKCTVMEFMFLLGGALAFQLLRWRWYTVICKRYMSRDMSSTLGAESVPGFISGNLPTGEPRPVSPVPVPLPWWRSMPTMATLSSAPWLSKHAPSEQPVPSREAAGALANQDSTVTATDAGWMVEDSTNGACDSSTSLCVVCHERPNTHMIYPCGHVCLCSVCATHDAFGPGLPCPVCRTECQGICKLYNTSII